MVTFVELLQHTFRKFQLKGEIALIDRDITNRQRKFGVELYDLIEKQRQKVITDTKYNAIENGGDGDVPQKQSTKDVQQVLAVFQTIENEIKVPLEATRQEVDDMEASTPKFPPIFIKRRKEEFGLEVYPIIAESTMLLHETLEHDLTTKEHKTVGEFAKNTMNAIVKGTKQTIGKAVGTLSPDEREIQECVDIAKKDIGEMEQKKKEKNNEIHELVSSGTTLECGLTDCGKVTDIQSSSTSMAGQTGATVTPTATAAVY